MMDGSMDSPLGGLLALAFLAAALVLVAHLLMPGLIPSLLGAMRVGPQPSKALDTSLPALTAHALRHADAKEAWDHVQRHGRFCKWSCPDGRTRYVCRMPGNRWAIVVLAARELVTAFTGDHDYARDVIDGCSNPWRMAHP